MKKQVLAGIASVFLMLSFPVQAMEEDSRGEAYADKRVQKSSGTSLDLRVIKSKLSINRSDIQTISLTQIDDEAYAVNLSLKETAASNLARLTEGNIDNRLMLSFAEHIISVATIKSELRGNFQFIVPSKEIGERIIASLSKV